MTVRTAALRTILLDRRQALQADVSDRVRTNRTTSDREVGDMLDTSEADIQKGLDFTLLQMKTEMLASIEHALRRLEAGTYGVCGDCEDDIAEARLRAIPFAVRCQSCQQRHENRRTPASASAGVRWDPETPSASAFR
ncbi:MAG: TraR/DksA C4-type zinc finger protein [Acidobacteria bacterium]|jgi:DnaK suppressor protein|nr:TraR/DksA C4-type zinc finger protein [Acidobacteriota bacterium]